MPSHRLLGLLVIRASPHRLRQLLARKTQPLQPRQLPKHVEKNAPNEKGDSKESDEDATKTAQSKTTENKETGSKRGETNQTALTITNQVGVVRKHLRVAITNPTVAIELKQPVRTIINQAAVKRINQTTGKRVHQAGRKRAALHRTMIKATRVNRARPTKTVRVMAARLTRIRVVAAPTQRTMARRLRQRRMIRVHRYESSPSSFVWRLCHHCSYGFLGVFG